MNHSEAQGGTMNHSEAQGGNGPNPPGSSYATSSSRGQVEGAAQSHAETQGQDTAKQETLRLRQQTKRENDRIRKEAGRAADDRAYSRICDLLAVRSNPKNTRSERSECLCIHRVGGVKRFVVLESVESIDQDFERMCELLEISMTPRKTLPHRSECFCIYSRRRY